VVRAAFRYEDRDGHRDDRDDRGRREDRDGRRDDRRDDRDRRDRGDRDDRGWRHGHRHDDECCREVFVPGRHVTVERKVFVPGHYDTVFRPAVYRRHGNHRHLVRPACHEKVWVPARWETRCEERWVPAHKHVVCDDGGHGHDCAACAVR
jgi:hypothetical protein